MRIVRRQAQSERGRTSSTGRQYYTALGHKKEDYSDPILRNQLTGGILWVIGARP